MIGIMNSYLASDFVYGVVGSQKQFFSLFNTLMVLVLDRSSPRVFRKLAADPVFADGIRIFQFVQ